MTMYRLKLSQLKQRVNIKHSQIKITFLINVYTYSGAF